MAKRLAKEKKDEVKVKTKNSYLPKIKDLFFKPKKFLSLIEGEKRYQVLIKDFMLIYILYFIISVLTGLVFQTPTWANLLMGFVTTVIAALVVPFVGAGIIHLGVLAFRGKKRFYETYKVGIYTFILMSVYSLILLIVQLIAWFILPYDMSILQQLQTIQDPAIASSLALAFLSQRGAKLAIAIYAIVNIIAIVHGFIFYITGLSKYHEIKRWKAALAIILPLLVLAALIVIILLILSSFGGG